MMAMENIYRPPGSRIVYMWKEPRPRWQRTFSWLVPDWRFHLEFVKLEDGSVHQTGPIPTRSGLSRISLYLRAIKVVLVELGRGLRSAWRAVINA